MTSCFNQTSNPSCNTFLTADQASRSHCDRLSWYEVFVIQMAILDAIQDCESCVTISNASPITGYSTIDSVTVINGGADYQPVEAEVVINHPNGSGEDIDVVVSNTGEITSFTVNSGGSNFEPVVAEVDSVTTTGGSGATFTVVVDSNGGITVVQVNNNNGGTGYSVGDTINISNQNGNGSGANVVVASVDGNGAILSTNVINAGSGYEPIHAQVVITHPIGFGFEGIVNVDSSGIVLGISIQNGGTAYDPLYPTLDITVNGGAIEGAEFDFDIDSGGEIIAINVTKTGYYYGALDPVTINPAPTSTGSGATAELVISSFPVCDWLNLQVVNPVTYYQVYTGQITDQTISKRIKWIKEYFECLGYTFEVLPNPDTNFSLMWKVCW